MRSILESIDRFAAETPDRMVLSDGNGATTWAELAAAIAGFAADFANLPDTVGVLMPRDRHAIAVDLALAALGKTIVPLPDFFSPDQWHHIVADSGLRAIVAPTELHDRLSGLAVTLHAPRQTAVLPLPARHPSLRIIYTSGTTGRPKGVVLTETAMETVVNGLIAAVQAAPTDVHLSVLPFSLLLEQLAGIFTPLKVGAKIHVATSPFEAEANGATTTVITPDILNGWVRALQGLGFRAPPCLRFVAVGGAPVGIQAAAEAWALGLPVHEGYGLSECCSVVAVNRPGQRQAGTAGRVLDNIAVAIEDGEIVVRGSSVMAGYLGGTDTLGVWRTGDLGSIDANGVLTVLGRKDDVVVTPQGRNVHPEWIEPLVLADSAIKRCAVIAGTKGVAVAIVPIDPAIPTDLAFWAPRLAARTQSLPDYARPKHITVLSADFAETHSLFTVDGRPRRRRVAHILKEPSMRFYDHLMAETAIERAAFMAIPLIVETAAHGIDRDTYVAFLHNAYHHVRYTVPLLIRAAAACGPTDQTLAVGLAEYVTEETGHEAWILDDIAALGGDPEATRNARPPLPVRVLVAHAFHLIAEEGPAALLGMVHVLEGMSVALACTAARAVHARLGGETQDGFSYLTSHGGLDVGHVETFAKLLDAIDSPTLRTVVIAVAKEFYVLYGDMFRALDRQRREADHAA